MHEERNHERRDVALSTPFDQPQRPVASTSLGRRVKRSATSITKVTPAQRAKDEMTDTSGARNHKMKCLAKIKVKN